jgi:hypothetical protein
MLYSFHTTKFKENSFKKLQISKAMSSNGRLQILQFDCDCEMKSTNTFLHTIFHHHHFLNCSLSLGPIIAIPLSSHTCSLIATHYCSLWHTQTLLSHIGVSHPCTTSLWLFPINSNLGQMVCSGRVVECTFLCANGKW